MSAAAVGMGIGEGPVRRMCGRNRLDIVVGRALGTVVMTVRGPLRKTTSGRLTSSISKALDEAPDRVVLDLTGLTACDDDGLAVLQSAKSSADERQVELLVTSRDKHSLAALDRLGDAFPVI